MKTNEDKLSFLQRRGWIKPPLQDREIFFNKEDQEEIIMVDQQEEEPTAFTDEEAILPSEQEELKKAIPPVECRETSTNDDMREKRKVVSFVSGDDYQALEQELVDVKTIMLNYKKRLDEIKKILT